MRWGQHETTQRRQEYFASVAPRLVAAATGDLPVWTGTRKLSGQFAFHGDDERLAIVVAPDASQHAADEALAWALALGVDRSIALIVPDDRVKPTLLRLPWIKVPVKVFAVPEGTIDSVAPCAVPNAGAVLDEVRSWGERGSGHDEPSLAIEPTQWIADLRAWADAHDALDPRHRQSYLSWHNAGRQVLRVSATKRRVEIAAGVRYSKPTADQPVPLPTVAIEGPLDDQMLNTIVRSVEEAIARRHAKDDAGDEEHRLQHALERRWRARHDILDVDVLAREYPAWRPAKAPAYVDFLASTPDRLHVIEVKLDNDVNLALQGLDYWIWARANADDLATKMSCQSDSSPVIDFVVGAHKTTKSVGPYTLRQLEAFADEIPWRFHIAAGWQHDVTVESLPMRSLPDRRDFWKPAVTRRGGVRSEDAVIDTEAVDETPAGAFVITARRAATAWKLSTNALPPEAHAPGPYRSWPSLPFCLPVGLTEQNLLPEARFVALERFAAAGIPWHDGGSGPSSHLLSSQVQCANTLAPFVTDPKALGAMFASALPIAEVLPFGAVQGPSATLSPFDATDHIVFEWQGLANHLNEWTGRPTRGSHATSADAAIRYLTPDGTAEMALIEWKYTERYPDGRLSGSASAFETRRRRYGALFNAADGPIRNDVLTLEDLFAEPVYQLLRLTLLAAQIERAHECKVRVVRVLYVAPSANLELARSPGSPAFTELARSFDGNLFASWRSLLREPAKFSVMDSAALVDAGSPTSAEFKARYGHFGSQGRGQVDG